MHSLTHTRESAYNLIPMDYENDSDRRKVRPGWLTVICVLAIVLGSLGLLSAGVSLFSQLFASRLQQAIAGAQGASNLPGSDLQAEVVQRSFEITRKYSVVMIPLEGAKILVEGALVVGAIMSLGLKAK